MRCRWKVDHQSEINLTINANIFIPFLSQKIVAGSPSLAASPEFNSIMNLGGIDVLAARLWLDRPVHLKNPSNVLAGFEPGTGLTLFDLNRLQVEILPFSQVQ